MAIEDAVDRVWSAIQSLPGAGEITVQWHCSTIAGRLDITIQDGSQMKLDDTARDRLKALVAAKIREALFPGLKLV